uniref:TOBE domain-containing protein n=1 Tax=Salmonella enterica TaxID=28901 RepID=UPI0020C53E27
SDPNLLKARIAFVEELGDVTYIHTDLPGGERLIVQSSKTRYHGGTECLVRLQPEGALLFDTAGQRIRSAH